MIMPLFPLNALVCPGGRLPLRVFEARYIDMVSQCLRNDSGFVVVMLKEGDEVGQQNGIFYALGTCAKIVDFGQTDEGLINITAEGQYRVKIRDPQRQHDGLWVAEVESASEEDFVELPSEFQELKEVLQALVQHPTVEDLKMDIDYHDGRQVGWRLTELLPLENAQKQQLFELTDPIVRLEEISVQLNQMMS